MRLILIIIVISQFLCASVWFAGNSIITDIAREFNLGAHFLANMTSIVQFGFISGTLVFAILTISDRFSPSVVFFISSILAGLFNLGISFHGVHSTEILMFRFFTGFFLAGIYPVGMKIASDYYQAGLAKSLGYLVGALVIGTAFPHLLKGLITGFPWRYVIYTTTILALIGGLCVLLLVPNGPYRKAGQKIKLSAFMDGFKYPEVRSAAFGYFGHMWELYTLWAFIPVILTTNPNITINVPLLSFLLIAAGGPGCVLGGILSQHFDPKKIAMLALSLSGLCCIISPLFLFSGSSLSLIIFLFFWGITVTADSPIFSSLVARNSPEESRGSSLTIVTCIGFAITIVSIQFINMLSDKISAQYIYMLLAIGPVIGVAALLKKRQHKEIMN
ncbi:MAG: MFS transporter [Chitinophagaceae bacterium]